MNEYDVEINGLTHRLQLSDEDAKRYGDAATRVKAAASAKQAAAPANKARTTENK